MATKFNEILKNFFQKGSEPVVLFSGDLTAGTITLTQSWRPFRRLYILFTTDDNVLGGVHEIDVAALKYLFDNKSLITGAFRLANDDDRYWYVNINTATDTSWPLHAENCRIKRILGVY